jgi:hypothetical protein
MGLRVCDGSQIGRNDASGIVPACAGTTVLQFAAYGSFDDLRPKDRHPGEGRDPILQTNQ